MVRFIVAGAFAALVISPQAVADDKKADTPWAKVILNREVGLKWVDFLNAPFAPPQEGKASFVRWLGPTPPGAKRFSRDTIQLTGSVQVITTKWSKDFWLSLCLEPNEEYLSATRKWMKFEKGESEEEQLRTLQSWAIFEQARDLHKRVDKEMEQLTKKGPDQAPLRIRFEGIVAAAEKAPPQPADLDAWKKQIPPNANHVAVGSRLQHPAILAVGQLDIADRQPGATPDPGKAWVEGRLEAGKYDVGGGKTSAWAIRNGTSPIALIGKGVESADDLKGDVRAVGRLRIGPDRQLLLEVDELKPLKQ